MKKFLVGMLMMFVFAALLPIAASGQDYCRKSFRGRGYNNAYYSYNNGRNRRSRNRGYYNRNYNRGYYQPAYYSYQRRPSFYRRHRNLINIGIGTGGGALLGALVGGRRGAGWGALAGAGASALYTYKINPKKRRYYRY